MSAKDDTQALLTTASNKCSEIATDAGLTQVMDQEIADIESLLSKLTKAMNDSHLPRSFYDEYAPIISKIQRAAATEKATKAAFITIANDANSAIGDAISLISLNWT